MRLPKRIEAAIISGDLQPGSKISEQALAASLGVSRGPLREAIRSSKAGSYSSARRYRRPRRQPVAQRPL